MPAKFLYTKHSDTSLHCGIILTHCILDNFSYIYFCRLPFSFKINLLKNSFRNTIRMSNSLDPDQARRFIGSDLGPNCLPRLSADDTGRQRVNLKCLPSYIIQKFNCRNKNAIGDK